MAEKERTERRKFEHPKLVKRGSVKDLTATGGAGVVDGGAGCS